MAGRPNSPPRRGPAGKKDPLSNPLRIKITASSCVRCGRFDPEQGGTSSKAGGSFRCRRCLPEKAEDDGAMKLAYCSLVYGKSTKYVSGALALGCSLQRSGTSYDRVLLHTADVPTEALAALKEFWRLQPVEYVAAASDLHRGKFEDVFTKLQAINPAAMPYDRVVFLDLDVLVRTNIDELFELRPPAAMCNQKSKDGHAAAVPEHGERMAPRACSINAGTMVLAPSQALFDSLVQDVQSCDAVWHRAAWSPEQSYLSTVMAGEWSHVDQTFNFEVQLHGGTPCSYEWENAKTSTIAIAHFSGAKPWDQGSTLDITAVRNKWSAEMFSNLSAEVQEHVTSRCRELHEEWHNVLSEALQHLSKRGITCRSLYSPTNGRAPA